MKKNIFLLLILTIAIGFLTGCGNKNDSGNIDVKTSSKKQVDSSENKYEVFADLTLEKFIEAKNNGATFFYIIDDNSAVVNALKNAIEEIANENQYTIYVFDYNKELNKLIKEKEKEINEEYDIWRKTYCDFLEVKDTSLYDSDEMEKRADGKYYAEHCFNSIAKAKNPNFEYAGEDIELTFNSEIITKIKEDIDFNLSLSNPSDLVYIHEGVKSGNVGQYLPEGYNLEKNAKELEKNEYKNLEKWFNQIIKDISEEK